MTTTIAKYSPMEAAIADLTSRYKGIVFDVKTPKGMAEAKAAYKDINGYDIALEAARVQEKAESLAYGRRVDSEAKGISDQFGLLKLPIKDMIETETKREQREREAAIEAEKQRILAEQAAAKAADEKRMAEARAEIARQQAELAARQRAQAEADIAARRKIEDEQRAAREKIEADERSARLQREEADRVARQARDAEEARLKAERDRIDAEARARARAEREAEEAKQRETQRLANELNDGYEMLATFVRKFGRRDEFKAVAQAIGPYLRMVKEAV